MRLVGQPLDNHSAMMKYLTKEQQTVLCIILLLLLTGLAVKTWRTAHPPNRTIPNEHSIPADKRAGVP